LDSLAFVIDPTGTKCDTVNKPVTTRTCNTFSCAFSDVSGGTAGTGSTTGFHKRASGGAVVLNDDIYVLAGQTSGGLVNDVWKSSDTARTWTQATEFAPFAARISPMIATIKGTELLVMGGQVSVYDSAKDQVVEQQIADVWKSTDKGKNWIKESGTLPWTGRSRASAATSPDNAYVHLIGGRGTAGSPSKEHWRYDGTTWELMTNNAPWAARYDGGISFDADGRLMLMGGQDGTKLMNDVWLHHAATTTTTESVHSFHTMQTTIGGTWERLPDAPWSPRSFTGHVPQFNEKLYIGSGVTNLQTGEVATDVWTLARDGKWSKLDTNTGANGEKQPQTFAAVKNSLLAISGVGVAPVDIDNQIVSSNTVKETKGDYRWHTEAWTPSTCQPDVCAKQTRVVICETASGTVVADSLCDATAKPRAKQICDAPGAADACSLEGFRWVAQDDWTKCIFQLGPETRTRTVQCLNAIDDVVENFNCDYAGIKPADTLDCEHPAAPAGNRWERLYLSTCSRKCNDGRVIPTQTGNVRCVNEKNENVLDEYTCPQPRITATVECNTDRCIWDASAPFNPCSGSCIAPLYSAPTQSRTVPCISPIDNSVVPTSYCLLATGTKPADTSTCNTQRCTGPFRYPTFRSTAVLEPARPNPYAVDVDSGNAGLLGEFPAGAPDLYYFIGNSTWNTVNGALISSTVSPSEPASASACAQLRFRRWYPMMYSSLIVLHISVFTLPHSNGAGYV